MNTVISFFSHIMKFPPNTNNSYDLSTPISVQEAIFALGYVDHDFFVFREQESNEISVVYKRNAGGFGLINAQSES